MSYLFLRLIRTGTLVQTPDFSGSKSPWLIELKSEDFPALWSPIMTKTGMLTSHWSYSKLLRFTSFRHLSMS